MTNEIALPEWSVALPVVLWLLARWHIHLAEAQSKVALQLLKAFIFRFITQCHVVWWVSKATHSDAWPTDYADQEKYAVHIDGHMVDLMPILQSSRMLSQAMHRRLVERFLLV